MGNIIINQQYIMQYKTDVICDQCCYQDLLLKFKLDCRPIPNTVYTKTKTKSLSSRQKPSEHDCRPDKDFISSTQCTRLPGSCPRGLYYCFRLHKRLKASENFERNLGGDSLIDRILIVSHFL
jgi:hypothetical protein